jgi:hypothetical protein
MMIENKPVLNFSAQAEQLTNILHSHFTAGNREAVVKILALKFKILYEQGVASGRLYEKEGVYPYTY